MYVSVHDPVFYFVHFVFDFVHRSVFVRSQEQAFRDRLSETELDDKHLELNVTKNMVMRQIRALDQPQCQQQLTLINA